MTHGEDIHFQAQFTQVQRAYNALHFYAMLPPQLRERAESRGDLVVSGLGGQVRAASDALTEGGLPDPARPVIAGGSRFYARRSGDPTDPTGLTLLAVTGQETGSSHATTLSIR